MEYWSSHFKALKTFLEAIRDGLLDFFLWRPQRLRSYDFDWNLSFLWGGRRLLEELEAVEAVETAKGGAAYSSNRLCSPSCCCRRQASGRGHCEQEDACKETMRTTPASTASEAVLPLLKRRTSGTSCCTSQEDSRNLLLCAHLPLFSTTLIFQRPTNPSRAASEAATFFGFTSLTFSTQPFHGIRPKVQTEKFFWWLSLNFFLVTVFKNESKKSHFQIWES